MLYLLDANVLITAHRLYYPLARVPEFWEWLIQKGTDGHVKMPIEMIEEVCDGTDDLSKWLSDHDHQEALRLDEEVDVGLVRHVIIEGYAADLTDQEVETMGHDPFLISYALVARDVRCIVTTEVSKPTRLRANRHIPDVCRRLQASCIDSFELVRALDFSTAWRGQSRS
ncbi:MAG: DUF4411 family protein [Roseiarcus sp.]